MTAYHPKASMIGATSVSTPIVLKPMPTGKLSPAQANLAASRFPFAFYQYLTPRHEIELAEKMLVEMRARVMPKMATAAVCHRQIIGAEQI